LTISITATAARGDITADTLTFLASSGSWLEGDLQIAVTQHRLPGPRTPDAAQLGLPTGFLTTAEQEWFPTTPFFQDNNIKLFFTISYRQVNGVDETTDMEFTCPNDWVFAPGFGTAAATQWKVNIFSFRADWGVIPGPDVYGANTWTADDTDDDAAPGFLVPPFSYSDATKPFYIAYVGAAVPDGSPNFNSALGGSADGYALSAQTGVPGLTGGLSVTVGHKTFAIGQNLEINAPHYARNTTGQMIQGFLMTDVYVPPEPLRRGRRGLGLVR